LSLIHIRYFAAAVRVARPPALIHAKCLLADAVRVARDRAHMVRAWQIADAVRVAREELQSGWLGTEPIWSEPSSLLLQSGWPGRSCSQGG